VVKYLKGFQPFAFAVSINVYNSQELLAGRGAEYHPVFSSHHKGPYSPLTGVAGFPGDPPGDRHI
jgi:hypothetical protein